jgi:hypothetical protein
MKTRRSFQPSAETLEPRTVLSSFTGAPALAAQKVAQEFEVFEQEYVTDVRTILVPSTTASPAANRPAFDAMVTMQLTTLNTAIDADIASLPTASSLAFNIKNQLLGGGMYSLRILLANVATPANTGFFAVVVFEQQALQLINIVEANVTTQVRLSPPPSGTFINGPTAQQALTNIQTAFSTFSTAYTNAISTILDPPGTTKIAANRPAFNNAVASALNTLNASVNSGVSGLPGPAVMALNPAFRKLLLTMPATPSLQSSLLSIPTPTSSSAVATMKFLATVQINIYRNQLDQAVTNAVNQYNLTGTVTSV